MSNSKRGEKVVTMKLPEKVHTAIKVLQRRYGTETLGEGLWSFITENDKGMETLVDTILDKLDNQPDPFDVAASDNTKRRNNKQG